MQEASLFGMLFPNGNTRRAYTDITNRLAKLLSGLVLTGFAVFTKPWHRVLLFFCCLDYHKHFLTLKTVLPSFFPIKSTLYWKFLVYFIHWFYLSPWSFVVCSINWCVWALVAWSCDVIVSTALFMSVTST